MGHNHIVSIHVIYINLNHILETLQPVIIRPAYSEKWTIVLYADSFNLIKI